MKYDHTAFIVKNINNSVNWYKEKFEAKELYKSEDWAFLEISGSKLALSTGKHPVHIAFEVSEQKLLKYSNEKIHNHRDGTKSIYFSDLDGNAVELIVYPAMSQKV